MDNVSFADIAIVSCGTLSLELNQLKKEGFLNTEHLYYTTPGLHQNVIELERQLVENIKKARGKTSKVIVVFGGKYCYVNVDDPLRNMQKIIDEQGTGIVRVNATHCMNMIANDNECDKIAQDLAGGEKVWWMTPGWVKYKNQVFKGWDKGIANENFPKHTGGAIVLDGIGYLDKYMEESPEEFLDYCDWMGIPMMANPNTLDRFKKLLTDAIKDLENFQ
jgi:hypothetical protein